MLRPPCLSNKYVILHSLFPVITYQYRSYLPIYARHKSWSLSESHLSLCDTVLHSLFPNPPISQFYHPYYLLLYHTIPYSSNFSVPLKCYFLCSLNWAPWTDVLSMQSIPLWCMVSQKRQPPYTSTIMYLVKDKLASHAALDVYIGQCVETA